MLKTSEVAVDGGGDVQESEIPFVVSCITLWLQNLFGF